MMQAKINPGFFGPQSSRWPSPRAYASSTRSRRLVSPQIGCSLFNLQAEFQRSNNVEWKRGTERRAIPHSGHTDSLNGKSELGLRVRGRLPDFSVGLVSV
jgi:hypothetical protein